MIVQHHDFKLDAPAGEDRFHGSANCALLVARRYQHRKRWDRSHPCAGLDAAGGGRYARRLARNRSAGMAARTRTTAVRPIVIMTEPRGATSTPRRRARRGNHSPSKRARNHRRPIVDAANAGLAADQCLECGGVAALGFTSQGVLGAGQGRFNAGPPLLNGSVGAPFDNDGWAEPGQRFGMALFPEGILQSQRQNDSPFQATCEMSHSRLNARRAFARVGKAALGRDPERGPRSSEDRAAGAEELPVPLALSSARCQTRPAARRFDSARARPRPWVRSGHGPETTRSARGRPAGPTTRGD